MTDTELTCEVKLTCTPIQPCMIAFTYSSSDSSDDWSVDTKGNIQVPFGKYDPIIIKILLDAEPGFCFKGFWITTPSPFQPWMPNAREDLSIKPPCGFDCQHCDTRLTLTFRSSSDFPYSYQLAVGMKCTPELIWDDPKIVDDGSQRSRCHNTSLQFTNTSNAELAGPRGSKQDERSTAILPRGHVHIGGEADL